MSRVLLTGVSGARASQLLERLGQHHQVSMLDGSALDLAACQRAAECDVVIQGLPDDASDLHLIQHASQGVWNVLTTTRATRYVLLSSMRLYDAYSDGWQVTEAWSPRPTTDASTLAPYLAEVASREITRARPIQCLVLRLDEASADGPPPETAVDAIVKAVESPAERFGPARWQALNVSNRRFLTSQATRDMLGLLTGPGPAQLRRSWPAPEWPPEPTPIADIPMPRKVAILGAGGPLGSITAATLAPTHSLRLSDYRPLAEIAAEPPQSTGAPLPVPTAAPHEEMRCDVTDPGAVARVVDGMDAIVNCTVIREEPAEAFRVNTIGAWNVMRAAAAAGVPRVVHNGPVLVLAPHPVGLTDDLDVGDDVPPRPGDNLYWVSKHLGQEICRVFAEHHRIACPTLLYVGFLNPVTAAQYGEIPHWFSISWQDAGSAMAAATTVPRLPEPLTVLHILADAPHGRYRNAKAKAVLGWVPQDRLDRLWHRRPDQ